MKRSSIRTLLGGIAILGVIAVLGLLVYHNSQSYLDGPQITVHSPHDGETVTEELLVVSGTAVNATDLRLNGRTIFITDEGAFREEVLLYPGYNEVHVGGTDRFGKTRSQLYRIIYKPPDHVPVASSTGTADDDRVDQ